jgi:hypothetical protein
VAFRGLARTPRRIAQRLCEAARACALAAAQVELLARAGGDPSGAMSSAADAQRASHRAALASAHMLGGGLDRSDVVGIARALQTLAASLEEAAFGLRHAEHRGVDWGALAGVVRDAARELAAAIDRLDGPARERDARLDRADELYGEWRRLMRTARAQVLSPGAEPMTALTADMALRRLESAANACRAAARTVRAVAIKHA